MSEMQWLRLEQVQTNLERAKPIRPSGGWLKTVRLALGRTERQQAKRVGISSTALHKSEAGEAEGRITLNQLAKLAEALDCDVHYTLIPRTTLSRQVEEQATALARKEVHDASVNSALDDKLPSKGARERQVARAAAALLTGRWSNLWK